MLEVEKEKAQAALQSRPFDFGFQLRPYQKAAIEAVEKTLVTEKREMLVAMATGTGKTKLAIAMLYRLLATKRFRRICFVVDRSALGTQTSEEFMSTSIEGPKTFGQLFGIMGLEDIKPDPETRVHICTIQGLVKRVLYNAEPADVPPIGQYDLMVIDECHRGYLLDREMSDQELEFRGQDDYISKYRRVLEHFDAVKIGLTATPALHTAQIFGDPIYTYTYREAVVDGWLIDHEPPIRFQTALSRAGITFDAGDDLEVLDTQSGEVQTTIAPDELTFEVEAFNRKVITQPFNQVIAEELAKHIDPSLEGKTLIFAATDAHADIVVNELKKAFAARYGSIEDSAIRKITGSVDKVGTLIRSFRNDAFPQIAATVDLLTTGIDVPKITNLVFIRRVNSRILYEQMLGRATRRCDDIGKEVFRIFDAVDLYATLQDLTQMKPVASNPKLTFEQLFGELATVTEEDQRALVRDQVLAKLHRKLRKLPGKVAQLVEDLTGETVEQLRNRLKNGSPDEAAAHAKKFAGLGKILDWDPDGSGPILIPISHHEDSMHAVTTGYGEYDKPEDFLDTFTSFVKNNQNRIAALTVVVQRPRDLTRAQLRSLRLELDRMGFSETSLRRAWSDASNEDIAASIIGYVRQAAIGDPLIPFDTRVHQATKAVLAKAKWSEPQKQWLRRIADQITKEIVLDRESIDEGTHLREPKDLKMLTTNIDKIDWFTAREDGLGDLYEGLMQKVMSDTKSKAGQYFTPRALIDCIVRLMKPQAGEIIQDPAAGTAGFLITADRYIKDATDDLFKLSEEKGNFQRKQAFRGHEWVPDTHRLCVMNMLLHGIESLVGCEDSCAPQGEVLGKADLILTNPPFNKMPSNVNRPDFTLTAGERVGPMPFLEHAIRMLKPGGRCAIVMPDSILFGDGAGAELRRFLMVNCNLHTVLRLPTGIFYAQGVKTNVLFFTRATNKVYPANHAISATECVWFYDLRTNMQSFGKTNALTGGHFEEFERFFGEDAMGGSVRIEGGEVSRWRKLTREQIAARNDNLDWTWLRDESSDPEDEMTEPDEIATAIMGHLRAALEEIEVLAAELDAAPMVEAAE